MRRLLNIKLIALLLLTTLNIAPSSAAANLGSLPAGLSSKFDALDFREGTLPDLDMYMYNRDEVIDLAKRSKIRLAVKSKPIYKSKDPIASFKADLYEILPGGDRLFISSQTLNVDKKSSKPAIFYMDLNKFDTNYKNVEIDLYDTDYNLVNTYSTQVAATNLDAQGSSVEEPIPAADCDGTKFDDCHLDYIFSRLVFEARPQKQISTRVIKGDDGNYTITFPVARNEFSAFTGSTLGGTTKGFTVERNLVSNGTFFLSPNGTALHYNEPLNQLEFMFPGHNGATAVLTHNGNLGLGSVVAPSAVLELGAGDGSTYAPLKFNPATLMTNLQSGAVEYDGHRLFITVDGTRQALAFGSEVEASRSIAVFTGDVGDDQLPTNMADKTINNLTVTGNFVFTGGTPSAGQVLTSDANGNASWESVASVGGISELDVFAHTLNGYTIGTQSSIAAISAANTLINGLALLERNAQLDRTSLSSVVSGLAAGTVEVAMAGDVTGASNGSTINGLALFAKQLKVGHSAGTFTAGAGTVTNGDTILGAFQKIVGNTNVNTANIATNAANIATNTASIASHATTIASHTTSIADIQSDLASGNLVVSANGDVTGLSSAFTINGLSLFAKQLKSGHSAGTFTAGAGTVTNGDTILGAFQKIVGNTNVNTAAIAALDSSVDDLLSGANGFTMGGDITGQTDAAVINGLSLYAKQLKTGHSVGTFTAGSGTVTNGDSLLSALQKIVGNTNVNTSNIATNTATITAHDTTLTSHTSSITSNTSTLNDLLNGDQAIPLHGDLVGYSNGVTLNGFALFEKELKDGNGLALFTPGPGSQTITNGDTLIRALEKIAGNIDRTEADIVTTATLVSSHAATISSHTTTLASHTTSINSLNSDVSDIANGDFAIPMLGEITGYNNASTINGVSMYGKLLKLAASNGLFTAGAGTVTNGDSLLTAMQKMVGNTNVNTASIASHATTLTSHAASIAAINGDVTDIVNGDQAIPLAGELGGDTGAATINGVALFTKQLKVGVASGLFTPGAGTVSNGDSLLGALQKIVGNVNDNTSDISSHATTLTSHATTLTSHTTSLASHATTLAAHTTELATLNGDVSDIVNGDQAIPLYGDVTGTTAAATINGLSIYSLVLGEGNGSSLFTPGPGNQTLTNADTLHSAIQKLAGNVDLNEADIAQNAADIAFLQNGGISLAFAGEITGFLNGAIINGVAMYDKELSEANGGVFTPGAGNETITNADTLHSALQKVAGNIDLNEASIASHATTLSTHTTNIAANAQNITDLANGDDAFSQVTIAQSGNSDVLLTNNNGYLEINGLRVITMNQIPGIDPIEAINVANGTPAVASVDYTDVDGNGTAAVRIKLTSDKVGGSTVTLNLGTVGPDLVPTSYVINGVETNFGTVPDSLGDAFTVPDQDYKVYVTGNKVRVVNVDPFSGLLGGTSYSKKTIRATYSAFTD